MEDKIIRIEEETGLTTVELTNGKKVPCQSKTIYTHYESGRKDCTVVIDPKPLEENK